MNVWIVTRDDGSIMGVFRTHQGAYDYLDLWRAEVGVSGWEVKSWPVVESMSVVAEHTKAATA